LNIAKQPIFVEIGKTLKINTFEVMIPTNPNFSNAC